MGNMSAIEELQPPILPPTPTNGGNTKDYLNRIETKADAAQAEAKIATQEARSAASEAKKAHSAVAALGVEQTRFRYLIAGDPLIPEDRGELGKVLTAIKAVDDKIEIFEDKTVRTKADKLARANNALYLKMMGAGVLVALAGVLVNIVLTLVGHRI